MKNKKLEKLLEQLGQSLAEPITIKDKDPEDLNVKMNNSNIFPTEEHQESEDVKEIVVESKN
jgi:hypothetical protein